MTRGSAATGIALAILVGLAGRGAAADPRFEVPVACSAGAGCIVRNYVDQDAGPEARDFRCGPLTYDGHKGTDIRVPDSVALAAGVPVLAAAPGTVLRLRDGMDDASIRAPAAASVADREAGNAVIIDHGDGWETQYSHLRKDSIPVKPGDRVTAGQPIGAIGLSGNTEFLHLHFEVRRNGAALDPYIGLPPGDGCNRVGDPLWSAAALAALPYRDHVPFDAGFASERPESWMARGGAYAASALPVASPALVFWIDVLGRKPGDVQTIRLLGPDGSVLAENSETVADDSIQWFQFIGRKRPGDAWPAGAYRGSYALVRIVDGKRQTIIAIDRGIELR